MANNMNFSASLRLDTKAFKQGVKDVQKSLNGLKNTFVQFAAGIGLSLGLNRLVGQLKDTAVQLDTAKNVLHNVSKGVGEYGENMTFLRKVSNAYNQDLVTLINTFGQFRAAADTSGLSAEELRDIFGSLTRAAGAFHMSADRTRDMMIAVQQMFSKGKVAAEELRRQLGNSLPGAFNLMAKAAGIAGITANGTTAELEDMMRKGKVLAADVMPAFAKVLDEVTAQANFDSLQGSLNRLKNTWTQFVEKAKFGDFFKGLVDAANKALGILTRNFSTFKALLIGGSSGLLSFGLWKNGANRVKEFSNTTATEIDRNVRKLNVLKGHLTKLDQQIAQSSTRRRADSGLHLDQRKGAFYGGPQSLISDRDRTRMIQYNETLIKQEKIMRSLGKTTGLTNKEIKKLEHYTKLLAAPIETTGAKTVKNVSKMRMLWASLVAPIKAVGAAIKSALGGILLGAAITAITTLITKWIDARKEAKRIENIVSDTEKAIEGVNDASSESYILAEKLKNTIERLDKEGKKGSTEWKLAIDGLNKAMGTTEENAIGIDDKTDDIVKKTNDWLANLKKIARTQAIINKINELTSRNVELESENELIIQDKNNYKGAGFGRDEHLKRKPQKQVDKNTTEIAKNTQAIDNLTSKLDEEGLKQLYGLGNTDAPEDGPKGGNKDKKPDWLKDIENESVDDKDMENLAKNLYDKVHDAVSRGIDDAINKEGKQLLNWNEAQSIYKNLQHGPGKRDTSFDYKKDDKEKLGETLELWEKWLETMTAARDRLIEIGQQGTEQFEQLNIAIGEVAGGVTNMRDAMKVAEWKKDIEDLSKQYSDKLYTSVKDVSSAFERLYNVYKDFAEVFGAEIDPDGNFQKILTIFGGLFETFETLYTLMKSINELTEIGTALEQAKNDKAMQQLAEQVSLTEALAAAETQEGVQATAALAQKTAATKILSQAKATEAAAAAVANAMEVPYPENLAALASNITEALAAMGMIKGAAAFAKGGIVNYGSSSGDKTLARVNRGEMILSSGEQATLFNALKSGNFGAFGGGKEITFRLKGTDIIGSINNTRQKMRG